MAAWRGHRRGHRGYGAGRQRRLGAAVLAAGLQLAVMAGLVAAFNPKLRETVRGTALAAFDMRAPEPPPAPEPSPPPRAVAEQPAGAAAPAGKRAVAQAVSAPAPRIALSPVIAPVVASTGAALSSGARDAGAGSGAGGAGQGTGSGSAGNRAGGGGKAVKIAGEINSAKDYPIASRDLRIDDYVIVAVTVGVDGRPTACRVHRASRDPAADTITCRLAMQRFRFRPATDAAGNPIEAVYGWKQSWHY